MEAEHRSMISEILRLHPADFARLMPAAECLARIGEINYQIIRHALERDVKSRT